MAATRGVFTGGRRQREGSDGGQAALILRQTLAPSVCSIQMHGIAFVPFARIAPPSGNAKASTTTSTQGPQPGVSDKAT